jgi:hypothetical protein
VGSALLLTAGGFLSVALRSLFPLLAAAVFASLLVARRWHTQPLITLTPEQVRSSRATEGGILVLLFASMFS